MAWIRRLAIALLGRYGATLRFPHLLLLAGLLFGIDLFVPDAIPFLDELVLGLLTLMFAAWKNGGVRGRTGLDGVETVETRNGHRED